ncbi:hypothetical protein KEM60_01176 [Austwickia sp. TVS 96-490-7B]|uniref:hypothetical protein n=1 Tax=Austwickia sp. TVS 96-490-7B TaxID=2830843 RepID=UPI001C5A1F42|nr:hypothetical protein [Austwickia sp. TVS 96-490-7B]MBW3084985.1 hypothetical protein [Austwickia sp. TVS 96-490-7B]
MSASVSPSSEGQVPRRDRCHVDPSGQVLTDSDLAMLARALGRVVIWPSLREAAPSQARHVAAIRTRVFGGRAGGDMITAMREYDARYRSQHGVDALGAEFIAACGLTSALAAAKDRRRGAPATTSVDVGGDVLRMWLGG